jgi:hypothetical protein
VSNRDPSLFARLGISAALKRDGPVWLEPAPEVCANGAIRPSVLVLMIDRVAGFIAGSRLNEKQE